MIFVDFVAKTLLSVSFVANDFFHP